MPDPISSQPIQPLRPMPQAPTSKPGEKTHDGADFADVLRGQLEKVSAMQAEADEGVQALLTGQTQNITEVFVTAQKANVAFNLLMEIRNKMVDAYEEMKNMRV